MDTMPANLWIAACAHRLQQQWHTVDPLELEDVARDLWRDERCERCLPTRRPWSGCGPLPARRRCRSQLDTKHRHRKNEPMCTRYISPEVREIEDFWKIDRRSNQRKDWENLLTAFPLSLASFIRRADEVEYARELVIGQWGMIPPWSNTHVPTTARGTRLSTVNARTEGMEKSPTYKDAWARGKRCIIPATSFDEPNWETGRNVWWRFRRIDGASWGLAGLWNTWIDKDTGEIWDSYTMLTINADAHPLMSRMHKPDPKLAPDKQDKRSVIPLEVHEFDLWLTGTLEEAKQLLKLAPVEIFDAGPESNSGSAGALEGSALGSS